jgi:hypothetical protein
MSLCHSSRQPGTPLSRDRRGTDAIDAVISGTDAAGILPDCRRKQTETVPYFGQLLRRHRNTQTPLRSEKLPIFFFLIHLA